MLVKLAWRNLGRNRRRTVITILAVAFATMFAIAMRGIQLGTYDENITFALRLFSGYIQLQAPGFRENPSLNKSFSLDEQTRSAIAAIPEITGFAPRVYADGLVSYQNSSLGTALFGIVPELEHGVTRFTERINAGRFFVSDTSDEIVVGYKLLENLKASLGDRIVVLAQARDGTLSNKLFTIVGTTKTGSQEFDGMAIFMGLSTLQDFLFMGDNVNVVAIALDDVRKVDAVKEKLGTTLDISRVIALPWEAVMPDLKQSIELDNISGIIFLGILILVVAFGILNTVLMSVTERFREFGVLLSLGMPQGKLVTVVLIETLFISMIGMLAGNILAAGINYYLIINPVHFSGDYASMMEQYGFLPILRSSLHLSSFANTTLSILTVCLISTVYPLIKTFRLEPLKGIRYT